MRSCSIAVVQMCSGPDLRGSVALAGKLAREALAAGVDLVLLPENCCGMGTLEAKLDFAFDPQAPAQSPALAPFLELSRSSDALVMLGGVPERSDRTRVYNTLVVLRRGAVAATYRKIHLFDVELPSGASLSESQVTAAGDRPVVLDTWIGRIGLSVCYDLRFPELYRALVDAGAEIIVVPSAFTLQTGADHWEPLVRARAIESQAYVLAAAQHGEHMRGRHSWGHAMVVDPWGTVVAQASSGDGVVRAELDADVLAAVRARLPSLAHRRLRSETSSALIPLTEGDGAS